MSRKLGAFDPASTATTTVTSLSTGASAAIAAVAQNMFPLSTDLSNTGAGDGVLSTLGTVITFSSAVGTPYGAGSAMRIQDSSSTRNKLEITSAAAVEMMEFSSAFTWEWWMWRDSGQNSSHRVLFDSRENGEHSYPVLLIQFSSGGFLRVSNASTGSGSYQDRTAGTAAAEQQWQHFAITRDSSDTLRMFIDGVKVLATSFAFSFDNKATGGRPEFFSDVNVTNNSAHYMRDLRIFKDTCVYTTSFSVPNQPMTATNETLVIATSSVVDTRSHSHVWNYSDIYKARRADSWPASSVFHPSSPSLVSLYIPGDTDVADASIHGHTLTATPGAAVSSAASVFGGASVYFDGGSYLNLSVSTSPATSTALVFGTGDFTLEYFINNHPNNANVNMMHPENESNTGTGYWAHIIQDRKLRWNHQYDVANLWEVNASADLFDNTFHHVAIVRNSGTFKVFIDGQSRSADSGTFTDSSNYVYSSGYQIGGHGNIAGGGQLLGYLDDFRITKHAVYTTAFTVPTAALGIQTFL